MTKMQFLKMPVALDGKDTKQVSALAHISDRMESSRPRKAFYSETHQDFFVIYKGRLVRKFQNSKKLLNSFYEI